MTPRTDTPAWYARVEASQAIQQSEIFVLAGTVDSYPAIPGETLAEFLTSVATDDLRAITATELADKPDFRRATAAGQEEALARAVAEKQTVAQLCPAIGLVMDQANQAAFDQVVTPPDMANAFASPSGGDITAEFAKLHDYFSSPNAHPLTLIVHDADLLFDASAPLVEPERTLLSYLRWWSARPLCTANNEPHTIFLISRSPVGIRPALLEGRIELIEVPLPNASERGIFVDRVLSQANEGSEEAVVYLEDGMTQDDLARVTGALDLRQIEDVIYQAEATGGLLTRDMVNDRKDLLVQQNFGGVMRISYPQIGFDDLIGYEEIKGYFTDYVEPLLRSGDPGCPKGCILAGPPGCLDANTPIFDPIDGTTETVLSRYLAQKPFNVLSLDKASNSLVAATAEAPFKYSPAELFEVSFASGRSITVTGGHRIWTGSEYRTVSDFSSDLQVSGHIPLPTIGASSLSASLGDARRWTETVGDSQADHRTRPHLDDGRPRPEGGLDRGSLPSQVDSDIHTHLDWREDGLGEIAERDLRHRSHHPSTLDSEGQSGSQIGSGSVPLRDLAPDERSSCSSTGTEPSPRHCPACDTYRQGAEDSLRPTSSLGFGALTTIAPPDSAEESSQRTAGILRIEGLSHTESSRKLPDEAPPRQAAASDSKRSRETYSLSFAPPFSQVDHIVSIEYVGVNNYYDFHVPGYENYWACGSIHHNTGKTVFAQALANALRHPLVQIEPDKIKSKFVGESNKNIAKLCEGIRALAPCIVFIDEIDKILPTSDDNTGVSQEILGQLQTFLGDIERGKAFFIATTNYPSRVPRALLRPGRFEEVIPFLPQHLDGLRHLVITLVAKRNGKVLEEGIDLESIGKRALDYTGADCEKLLISAHKRAVLAGRSEIGTIDLESALVNVVPTLRVTQSMVDEALEFSSERDYVPESLRPKVGEINTEIEKPKGERRRVIKKRGER